MEPIHKVENIRSLLLFISVGIIQGVFLAWIPHWTNPPFYPSNFNVTLRFFVAFLGIFFLFTYNKQRLGWLSLTSILTAYLLH